MKQPVQISALPLLKSKAEIIERSLVDIMVAAIGPQFDDVLRREVQDMPELSFALADFLFRLLALGDVCRAAHEFRHIPGGVENRMADGVDMFDRAVWKWDSEFDFIIRLFTYCSIDCLLPLDSILWMNALQAFAPSRRASVRIEVIYAIPFLGKIHSVSSRYPPNPSPRMRERLCFRQISLAPPQCLLSTLALRDVRYGTHKLEVARRSLQRAR